MTLRGYGESLPKPRDFPDSFYRRDAGDLLAFMDALSLERAHLIGYSDGGEVALIAAGQAPERVASCIAIGAIGNFGPELRPVFQRMYPGDWITDEDKALHGFSDAARFTGEWARAMTRMIDAGGDVSLSLAKRITCPLIIMLGEADKLNPQRFGQRFVDAVPNGKLAIFACGHAVQDEQPEALPRDDAGAPARRFRRIVADESPSRRCTETGEYGFSFSLTVISFKRLGRKADG